MLEQTIPGENILKVVTRAFSDEDLDICEAFYNENISKLEHVLKNGKK